MEKTDDIQAVFKRFLDDQHSSQDLSRIQSYLNSNEDNDALSKLVEDKLSELGDDLVYDEAVIASILSNVDKKVFASLDRTDVANDSIRQISFVRRLWRPLAIAAVFLVALTVGYLVMDRNKESQSQMELADAIFPGGNKAVLVLSDGTSINLNDVDNGLLAEQSGMKIEKDEDGLITYELSTLEKEDAVISYNSIVTPNGGQYKVILSDGTSVWLNAASSLRYPTRFSGNERRVELVGEGYFEVAENKQMPFIVESEGQKVQVLGTHFNINTYDDENIVKTTLLEGAVKVSTGKQAGLLSPGEQARVNLTTDRITISDVNVERIIAWKNGRFSFEETNIRNIMKQVSRWYDVDVSFEGDFSAVELSGVISRTENVAQLLKLLKGTRQVDFKLVGKSITVFKYK